MAVSARAGFRPRLNTHHSSFYYHLTLKGGIAILLTPLDGLGALGGWGDRGTGAAVNMPDQPQPNPWRHAGAGLELAGVVGVLAWIGYGLDRWWGTQPWCFIGGATVGIVGGLYNLVKSVLRNNQPKQ